MKIKITLMTENNEHLDMPKEDIEANALVAWQTLCSLINIFNPEERIEIENCEVIEE